MHKALLFAYVMTPIFPIHDMAHNVNVTLSLTLKALLKIIDLPMYLILDNGEPVHNTLKDNISLFLFPLKPIKQ